MKSYLGLSQRRSRWLPTALALAFVAMLPGMASAQSLTFDLNTVITGSTPAANSKSYWVRATFENATRTVTHNSVTSSRNGVLLTIENALAGSKEFLTKIAFNYIGRPTASPDALFAVADPTPSVIPNQTTASFTYAFDHNVGGLGNVVGNFDLDWGYSTSGSNGGANRFKGGETSQIFIYAEPNIPALDYSMFNATSVGGTNSVFAAAHIQGIGGDDNNSGKIAAVPEPATYAMTLTSMGLVGLIAGLRRRAARRSA